MEVNSLKKLLKLIFCLIIATILQACNADNDNVSAPPENAPIEKEEDGIVNNETEIEQNEDGTLYNFSSFDLDIEYEQNNSFDVSYENESNEMEAEIKDQINNITLQGDDAFEQLRPIFQKLTFDQNTPDQEVIEEVIREFELSSDYKKFELEVEFADGTEKEYKTI